MLVQIQSPRPRPCSSVDSEHRSTEPSCRRFESFQGCQTRRGSVWLERRVRDAENGGSNPLASTKGVQRGRGTKEQRNGMWLSLVRAPVWGTGDHWFESSHPDEGSGRGRMWVMASDHKRCNRCGTTKPTSAFSYKTVYGGRYLRTACRICENKKRSERRKRSPSAADKVREQRQLDRRSRMRAAGIDLPRWILTDSRASDRKKGLSNDLTKSFIAERIAQGCCYCGDKTIRMTLDRIDNNQGHTRNNVVPACIRCNYIRRDMPFEAWLLVTGAIREARKRGLFGEWTGRARKPRMASKARVVKFR